MWGRHPKNNSVLKLWSVISHQPWYLPWSTKGTSWSMLWKRRQLLHPCNKVCFGVNLLEGSFLKPQAAAWHLWPQSFKLTQNRVFKRVNLLLSSCHSHIWPSPNPSQAGVQDVTEPSLAPTSPQELLLDPAGSLEHQSTLTLSTWVSINFSTRFACVKCHQATAQVSD